MATAGWIATTVNFTWPLAFAMFALLTVKRLWEGVHIPAYRWALYIVAVLYASDAEQALMVLIVIIAVLVVYQVYKKAAKSLQYKTALYSTMIFLAARLIFTLTAPGNHVRLHTDHYLVPGFANLSLWQKLTLSFELTAMHYIFFTLALFPFFALFLCIVVWKSHKNIIKRTIAAIPLGISLVLSAGMAVNAVLFAWDNLEHYEGWFIDAFIVISIPGWSGSTLLFMLFFICLLYTLYLSCLKATDRWLLIGIMLLGIMSQLILGLSQSLYGSALRTFIYAAFAIIICAVYLYENGAKMYLNKGMKVLLGIACFINIAITFAIGIVRMTV